MSNRKLEIISAIESGHKKGLTPKEIYTSLGISGQLYRFYAKHIVPSTQPVWSEKDVAFLIANGEKPDKWLAARLNRTVDAIVCKKYRIKQNAKGQGSGIKDIANMESTDFLALPKAHETLGFDLIYLLPCESVFLVAGKQGRVLFLLSKKALEIEYKSDDDIDCFTTFLASKHGAIAVEPSDSDTKIFAKYSRLHKPEFEFRDV